VEIVPFWGDDDSIKQGWDATALHPGSFPRIFVISHPSQRARRMGHPGCGYRATWVGRAGGQLYC